MRRLREAWYLRHIPRMTDGMVRALTRDGILLIHEEALVLERLILSLSE